MAEAGVGGLSEAEFARLWGLPVPAGSAPRPAEPRLPSSALWSALLLASVPVWLLQVSAYGSAVSLVGGSAVATVAAAELGRSSHLLRVWRPVLLALMVVGVVAAAAALPVSVLAAVTHPTLLLVSLPAAAALTSSLLASGLPVSL